MQKWHAKSAYLPKKSDFAKTTWNANRQKQENIDGFSVKSYSHAYLIICGII